MCRNGHCAERSDQQRVLAVIRCRARTDFHWKISVVFLGLLFFPKYAACKLTAAHYCYILAMLTPDKRQRTFAAVHAA